MSDVGYFCFLVDSDRELASKIVMCLHDWVDEHDTLKNLVTESFPIPVGKHPTVISGSIDFLTPAYLHEFLAEYISDEERKKVNVFTISSTYGDLWEEVG